VPANLPRGPPSRAGLDHCDVEHATPVESQLPRDHHKLASLGLEREAQSACQPQGPHPLVGRFLSRKGIATGLSVDRKPLRR